MCRDPGFRDGEIGTADCAAASKPGSVSGAKTITGTCVVEASALTFSTAVRMSPRAEKSATSSSGISRLTVAASAAALFTASTR